MFNKEKSVEDQLAEQATQQGLPMSQSDLLLRELAVDYMKGKKTKRRWRMLFMLLVSTYFISALYIGFKDNDIVAANKPHTALVELKGVIGTDMGVSSDQINQSMRKAFEAPMSKGVVLRINSPGGTPVQSAEISDEIVRLREQYPNKPLYVVVSDTCASGGYFIAASAEKIYANRSSLVGSIGVRMDSFGFVDAMKKYGIERRSITAGENKAILDPFLPMSRSQKAHAEKMLSQVHQHFIDAVKHGRGDKLADNPDLFSGLFWSGEEAKELGLIDEFGSLDSVATHVIGASDVVNYTVVPSFLDQFSRQFGVSIGKGVGKVLMQNQYQIN